MDRKVYCDLYIYLFINVLVPFRPFSRGQISLVFDDAISRRNPLGATKLYACDIAFSRCLKMSHTSLDVPDSYVLIRGRIHSGVFLFASTITKETEASWI